MRNDITEAMLERLGFRRVYEAEYRIRRDWFTDKQSQEWRRITPLGWSSHPRLKDVRDEAIALYRSSSRGRSVCFTEADAVRIAELKMAAFRRAFENGLATADWKPTALRITSHWEYFGDIEKQSAEVVREMEVR